MIDKNLLEQIKQRTDKLIEEQDKLENMEFNYHTMCNISDYSIIQEQKDLVDFLIGKLKNSISVL